MLKCIWAFVFLSKNIPDVSDCSYFREKLQFLKYKFYLSISQTSSRSNGNSEFNCSLKNKKIDLNEKLEFSANNEIFL